MNMDETIKRINELYHKSQDVGLNEEEKEEQKRLRKVYIDSVRGSLVSQLDNVDIKEADGSVTNLGEVVKKKREIENADTGSIKAEKSQLRSRMSAKRDSIAKEDRLTKSIAIKDKLLELDCIRASKCILLYASYNSEVSTFAVMDECRKLGKHVAFPKCTLVDGVPNLEFYEVAKFSQLSAGYKGILEPDTNKYNLKKVTGDIEAIVIPGICFDKSGNRMGYGKGFYDRFLSGRRVKAKVGIAFSEQIVENVPTEKYDLPMNIIVTDTEIIECR